MTRADFYIGRNDSKRWIGSVACDGHPEAMNKELSRAVSEEGFRAAVLIELAERGNEAIYPDEAWPWPWDGSELTDFAYAFDEEKVWVSNYGEQWIPISS